MVEARFLVISGAANDLRYVERLRPDPGDVEWTSERTEAHRFTTGVLAHLVQRQIVVHDRIAVAVVPESV